MVIERNKPNSAEAIYKRVREKGRLIPDGLNYIDSWVAKDLSICYQLMETNDATLFDEWFAAWSDLVDFDLVPVVSSAEAAALASAKPPQNKSSSGAETPSSK